MGCCASKSDAQVSAAEETSWQRAADVARTQPAADVAPTCAARESNTTNSMIRKRRYLDVDAMSKAFSRQLEMDDTSDDSDVAANESSTDSLELTSDTIEILSAALSKSRVFTGMSKLWLRRAASAMFLVEHDQGDTIIRQGAQISQNDCLYYLIKGKIQILVSGGESGNITEEAGFMFGDVALLFKGPRSASVIASTDVKLWAMTLPNFDEFLPHAPEGRKLKFMRALPLLQGFGDNDLLRLSDKLTPETFPDRAALIRQGDSGDCLYFIRNGQVSVHRQDNNGNNVQVALLGRGETLGQRTLITGRARTADCIAVGKVHVFSINIKDFSAFSNPILTYILDTDVIKTVQQIAKPLGDLTEIQLQQMVDKFETVVFVKGDVLFETGDVVSALYIVRNGEIKSLSKNVQQQTAVKEAGGFMFCGSVSSMKAPATVTVTSDTASVLVCDRQNWLRVVSDVTDERDRDTVGLQQLSRLQNVGSGSCGKVQLVRNNLTGELYALKIVNKKYVEGTKQAQQVLNERSVMQQLKHPFCVRLYNYFSDESNIYLLLQWMPGGELFHHLAERGCFDENTAKFYAACVVTALQHMHSCGIIYRDLKPENLLLGEDGYLRITDFGFAKQTYDKKTFTMCGTPAYIAPEIIQHTGTTKAADWWSFGILIHEMLIGETPFEDENPLNTYRRAINGRFVLPNDMSRAAADLIKKLVVVKPEKRLGQGPRGADGIRSHPWFSGFDWAALENFQMPAPFLPKLRNSEDTSNFDSDI